MDHTIKTSEERVDLNMISPALKLIADNWPMYVDPDDKTHRHSTHLRCRHCVQSIICLSQHGIGYEITQGEIASATLAHLIQAHGYEMDGSCNAKQ